LAENEPLQVTLVRTGGIALVVGLVVAATQSVQVTGRLLIWLGVRLPRAVGARVAPTPRATELL